MIVGRRDVFGQLPTGFGKSFIFSTAAIFQLLDIPAWPVRQNNFTGLAKFHSQQIILEI